MRDHLVLIRPNNRHVPDREALCRVDQSSPRDQSALRRLGRKLIVEIGRDASGNRTDRSEDATYNQSRNLSAPHVAPEIVPPGRRYRSLNLRRMGSRRAMRLDHIRRHRVLNACENSRAAIRRPLSRPTRHLSSSAHSFRSGLLRRPPYRLGTAHAASRGPCLLDNAKGLTKFAAECTCSARFVRQFAVGGGRGRPTRLPIRRSIGSINATSRSELDCGAALTYAFGRHRKRLPKCAWCAGGQRPCLLGRPTTEGRNGTAALSGRVPADFKMLMERLRQT